MRAVWTRLAVCLILFLIAPLADAWKLPVKVYTTDDGLPLNTIIRIVRDSRGFPCSACLWRGPRPLQH